MDPITAISLLASLSSLIQASGSVLGVMKSFKDGEKELAELFNDVSIFEENLKAFDRVLRNCQTRHDISAKVINSALDEAFATIQDLEMRLLQISEYSVSAIRRMKWVQHGSSFKKIHGRLKEQNAMLHSFVALAHIETYLAVCSQHPEFVQTSLTVVDEIESDAVSLHDTIRPETTTLSSRSSVFSPQRTFFDASSTSPLFHFDGDRVRHEAVQKTNVKGTSADALTIRRACRFDCYCKCHAQTMRVSGSGFLKLTAPKHRCTEPNCRGATPVEGEVVTPAFFRRTISQMISSRSIKVRYNLNTYRMVSEGSDAIRYIKHGNLEKLKMCIETGEATLWDTAPDGWSLLHTAAYGAQLHIVKYLLEIGADTEVADVGTRKPADLAISRSLAVDDTPVEQEIVEVFSQKDDYISDFEFTPIHIAVLDLYDPTDLECPTLEELIQVVDDANNAPVGTDWAEWKLRYRGRSPLFGAIIEFFRASAYGKPKTYKVIHNLLDQKDRKNCWSPLHWASSTGRADKMKVLIDHGADPFILSNLNANILHAAAESKTLSGLIGGLEIWKHYPQQLNINQPNYWLETPLHLATCGSVGCVKLLLEVGADRSVRQEDQQVPLHYAGLTARGDIRRQMVALLCDGESGPHIDAQDVDGRPPIFDLLDDPECIELLINYGARLDLLDTSGKSLFHHACIQDESEGLKTLLRLCPGSIMVTVKDHDGNSPLVQALCHGSVECAMTLLELDDVGDIVGQGGWAAVHWAAKLGDTDVLEAVLKHPSFVKGMKTIDGKTAEVVAMEAGNWHGKVKELLRKYNLRR